MRILGATFVLAGAILVIIARIQLGDAFSFRPKAKTLVIRGLYSRIRNPMYLFLDLIVLGLALALSFYWLLMLLAILIIAQSRQAVREARALREKFGQSYLDYRERTWF